MGPKRLVIWRRAPHGRAAHAFPVEGGPSLCGKPTAGKRTAARLARCVVCQRILSKPVDVVGELLRKVKPRS